MRQAEEQLITRQMGAQDARDLLALAQIHQFFSTQPFNLSHYFGCIALLFKVLVF